jgi:hypothetical protein
MKVCPECGRKLMGDKMKVCPTCGRNLNKNMHNWSEIVAGFGALLALLPIINFVAKYDKYAAIDSMGGFIILYIACVVHLYSEVRTK